MSAAISSIQMSYQLAVNKIPCSSIQGLSLKNGKTDEYFNTYNYLDKTDPFESKLFIFDEKKEELCRIKCLF